MIQLKVTNMKCEGCTKKIGDGLSKAGIAANVELSTKMVSVEEGQAQKAKEVISSLGYKVEE